MRANEKNLLRFLEGTDKNFIIPVYQRNYDWKIKQCKQLFDDLSNIINDNFRTHFMGSIVHVYSQEGESYEYMIIDGQQRLTTISLLLLAIHNIIKSGQIEDDKVNVEKIRDEYLIDKYAHGNKKIKLKPIKDDSIAFERLFGDEDKITESNITHNYNYIYENLLKTKHKLSDIYKAVEKLIIVEIELKAADDDPQLIFESLNSTGLGLTEADKVRNYILMKQERTIQERFYDKYWNKIEISTQYKVSPFLRDYLTIKNNKIPKIEDVYFAFKAYHRNCLQDLEDILIELLSYSKIYNSIITNNFDNIRIKNYITDINNLETVVSYPFILELLADHHNGIISETQCEDVLMVVRDYVFRRSICEIPTNSLNKTFMTLSNDIKKHKNYSIHYSDICKHIFINKESYQRFPDDDEFSEKFEKRDIYNQNKKNKLYLLTKLENHKNKEQVKIEELVENQILTIEHVMPQTLTYQWKSELGENWEEVYNKYLHTIGNITLTGYNSEMKNHSFLEKRDHEKGFKNSRLRLNKSIAINDNWSEIEISNRANILKDLALDIWKYPETNYFIEENEPKTYSLNDEKNFTGERVLTFSFIESDVSVKDWTDFYVLLFKQLYELDASMFNNIIAGKMYNTRVEKCFSRKENNLRSPKKIDENVYVEANLSTEDKLMILREVVKYMNLNLEEVIFEIG
jgi:uncharacterized protein with ParB-like and HNH nuclease domain